MEKIYIVGAHSRAQTLAVYLQYLYPGKIVEAYLYDNEEENPEKIGETKVLHLDEKTELHLDYPVYIGTRSVYHQQITDHLRRLGFKDIYPVTVELDLRLRNEYMKKFFSANGREFIKIHMLQKEENNKAAVYVVKSIHDKPLQQEYTLAPYEKEIQAGAALTEKRFGDGVMTDDIGDNISDKNNQFSELTALYWIWKHTEEDIIGMVHYRRHFILPEDWVERMRANNVDVILPVPLYVLPNLAENFKKRHDSMEWDCMMEYLKETDIQEFQEADEFFRTSLYSPCNMFIMRRHVLDSLCTWLFPILFKVAQHCGEKEDCYLNRYPGFLSERLMTFFFERFRDEYKVVYSDKNFLL